MGNLISVAGSAPGGVGVNAAAFIGYRLSGISGAILAVIGITLPTLVIVSALSLVYSHIHTLPKVMAALKGIHAGIIALILIAAYRMAKASFMDKTTVAIGIASLGLLLATSIHPIIIIALGIAAGLLTGVIKSLMGIAMYKEKANKTGAKTELVFPEYYI
ncbi:chromate transporter [Paenibacillus hexagrammi]|uniref:Chromate transporter n=1 Tax=Paenibacillus hexagrammi TaxID=2908839 RepID=A0ABY3SEC1_9BACL|nr:chromate transporter [Paenibacillus sp. YPD9-1]UJF32343.1 chromate transporter [Paenibacillus sp. YPD9-1]